ncbi:MAG: glycosyltransferase [Alphaproteobacteria bacterium]|nr:MAG: glycosyltransferase [Alphaproteobacteria bacterium]
MISVVIPTLNAEATLPRTFAGLYGAALNGLVREVIVSDGGSVDATLKIADAAGAKIIEGPKGRGSQLQRGADQATSDWLLFLHADTRLEEGWSQEIDRLITGRGIKGVPDDGRFAAAFRFALDDLSARARWLEKIVALRCRLLKLPYGDQGLLLSRKFYREIGGFDPIELMEDVAIIRKAKRAAGRKSILLLRNVAITSAEKFQRKGYLKTPLRNAGLLTAYFLKVPPRILSRLYD